MNFPLWLSKHLVVQDRTTGVLHPPGGNQAATWRQPDGADLTIIARGDALDLYIGRRDIYNITVTPQVAVKLAWWILTWWARGWFGLKLKLWFWSLGRIVK